VLVGQVDHGCDHAEPTGLSDGHRGVLRDQCGDDRRDALVSSVVVGGVRVAAVHGVSFQPWVSGG
jgi:hypothetical protein